MLKVVLALGTTQTLAWASVYYIPAILAEPVARDLGSSPNVVFAAFSMALLISALLGPRIGRHIDVLGGRGVLAFSNVLFATGLTLLGLATSPAMVFAAWALLGIGLGCGLYDAAFAALNRIFGLEARVPISGITLMGGLASTIGWPLTAWGVTEIGWRETCFAWAAAHMLLGLPLNLFLLPRVPRAEPKLAADGKPDVRMDRTMWLLAFTFAAGWLVAAAMAAHLPRLIMASGASYAEAIFAASLFGPAQVLARMAELTLGGRFHPLTSARLAMAAHPLGALLIGIAGAKMGVALAMLHGAGNGVLTIARGTVPLAVFGPDNFGYRIGLIGAPSRIAQAFAPLAFGLLIDRIGAATLLVTAGLSLAALAALLMVPSAATDRTGQHG